MGRSPRNGPQEAGNDHRHRAEGVSALSDPFDELYETGVLEELPPETERAPARAMPAEPFALKGCVITPDRSIEDGYVAVNGAKIASVGSAKPGDLRIVETDGVILPGLIDLHGHPEYNVFAAWEPPRMFPNRYAWRGSEEYRLRRRRSSVTSISGSSVSTRRVRSSTSPGRPTMTGAGCVPRSMRAT